MNITLWVLQILLAALFLLHGGALILPPATMRASFAADFVNLPPGTQVLIGSAELLAGLGLILPGITRIAPWLTPLAATGLVPIMLGAIVVHARRGEAGPAIFNMVTTVLLALVAYLRWRVLPLG